MIFAFDSYLPSSIISPICTSALVFLLTKISGFLAKIFVSSILNPISGIGYEVDVTIAVGVTVGITVGTDVVITVGVAVGTYVGVAVGVAVGTNVGVTTTLAADSASDFTLVLSVILFLFSSTKKGQPAQQSAKSLNPE